MSRCHSGVFTGSADHLPAPIAQSKSGGGGGSCGFRGYSSVSCRSKVITLCFRHFRRVLDSRYGYVLCAECFADPSIPGPRVSHVGRMALGLRLCSEECRFGMSAWPSSCSQPLRPYSSSSTLSAAAQLKKPRIIGNASGPASGRAAHGG